MTKILTLKDYKKIRTPFVFFDETGSINDQNNRFFGLGMIKCMQPYFLDNQIRLIRQRNQFYDEIKFNKISNKSLPILKEIIDSVFATPGIKFCCTVINKDTVDFKVEFGSDPYLAYQKFTEDLLMKNISETETLIVLADYISTPSSIHFEVEVKHSLNSTLERLAVAGVHRVDSHGVNLIQVADLLLGAVIYEHKMENKLVSGDKNKIELYKYILAKIDCATFTKGCSDRRVKIAGYK